MQQRLKAYITTIHRRKALILCNIHVKFFGRSTFSGKQIAVLIILYGPSLILVLVLFQDQITLQFRAENLDKKDVFGKSDGFLVFNRSNESGE